MTLMAWCFGGSQVSELSCFNKEAGDWEMSSCFQGPKGLNRYLNFQI